ncbi:hypothetical protein PIB30_006272 [Stylosanthes scabra]|uniref:TIR domain-containing protein n=1 Tax=Stylosanthes scabra TaxID=79078 RepID=A0ABU6Q546_9FABA|nr:hypothetical protein [Stylosanthes scabra]
MALFRHIIGLAAVIIAIYIPIISRFDGQKPVVITVSEIENAPPPYPEPSSLLTHQTKYDVFISFSGKDIRDIFLSHLTKALYQKQIVTFVDTQLNKGGEISLELLRAIERSLISLVVFSESYASSAWCLDELVKIMECRREQGQIVIPVFYKVEPSDVRHSKGVFSDAFAKQEKRHGKEKVQSWRSTFGEAANISGFHSTKFG